MPYIGPLARNITLVISRAGDLQPFTTSIGALGNSSFDLADTDTFLQAMGTAALPNLSTAETLVQEVLQYNDGAGIIEYVHNDGRLGTGATAAALVPQNSAILIQKRTALPGKHGRGRMYWPSMGEADVDGVGAISPGAKARIATMLTAWTNAVNTATSFDAFAVLHTTSTPAATKITSLTVDSTLATQRRRLRK